MKFDCPKCGLKTNVVVLPITCCGVRHDETSAAISEGSYPRKEPVKRKPRATQDVLLGDWVEQQLTALGITQDRYKEVKQIFGWPPNCNCDKRKEWLNRVKLWSRKPD